MAYVLVYVMGDLKYYVQNKNGKLLLNGLVNNAVIFGEIPAARVAAYTYGKKLGKELLIEEILPKSNHPTT